MQLASVAAAAMIGLMSATAAQAGQAQANPIAPVPLPPLKKEWSTESALGGKDVVASFKHNDGSALSVICDIGDKKLTIAFQEPRAKWTAGQGMDAVALPDSGQQVSPSYGMATAPTQVILKHDTPFDVWTMAQAKDFFKFSVGDFARVFPAANFRDAVAPVLKACGGQ